MVLFVCHAQIYAQFSEDMEGYTAGDPVCINWWSDWDGDCSAPIISSTEQVRSGAHSGKIPGDGTTHAVLDLGNKIFGEWCFKFWMYVPSNKEATLSLQGTVPIDGSGESVVGDFRFNPDLGTPGQGYIEDTALGQVNFTFPHDQWFDIYIVFDINFGIEMAIWRVEIDDSLVIPLSTPYTNEIGEYPTSLGGMALRSSNTDHLFYVDDLTYSKPIHGCFGLSTEDFRVSLFTLSPNPVTETLYIQSERSPWQTATIYSLSGSKVVQTTSLQSPAIDVSALSSGLYFMEITSEEGSEVIRFVKE
ncbi:MAG: hypothetical protein Aureis2KO_25370 [Aureisphaera sp.]